MVLLRGIKVNHDVEMLHAGCQSYKKDLVKLFRFHFSVYEGGKLNFLRVPDTDCKNLRTKHYMLFIYFITIQVLEVES